MNEKINEGYTGHHCPVCGEPKVVKDETGKHYCDACAWEQGKEKIPEMSNEEMQYAVSNWIDENPEGELFECAEELGFPIQKVRGFAGRLKTMKLKVDYERAKAREPSRVAPVEPQMLHTQKCPVCEIWKMQFEGMRDELKVERERVRSLEKELRESASKPSKPDEKMQKIQELLYDKFMTTVTAPGGPVEKSWTKDFIEGFAPHVPQIMEGVTNLLSQPQQAQMPPPQPQPRPVPQFQQMRPNPQPRQKPLSGPAPTIMSGPKPPSVPVSKPEVIDIQPNTDTTDETVQKAQEVFANVMAVNPKTPTDLLETAISGVFSEKSDIDVNTASKLTVDVLNAIYKIPSITSGITQVTNGIYTTTAAAKFVYNHDPVFSASLINDGVDKWLERGKIFRNHPAYEKYFDFLYSEKAHETIMAIVEELKKIVPKEY